MSGLDVLLAGVLLVLGALVMHSLPALRQARVREAKASRERASALSALRETQVALAKALSHLDGVGEAALDALLLLDGNRRVLWANQAVWDMFSAGAPAIGQSFIGLVRDYELNQAVADALSGNRSIVRQAALNERTLRIHAVPLEATAHGEYGAAVAIEDVTELQRLGRARRDLVANISHELRTPLANIDLAAQTLEANDLQDRSLAQRMIDQIQAQVQALSQLSQEMIDLAQIESGRVLLKLVPANLAETVNRSVELLQPQAQLKALQLSVVVPSDLIALMDEQQVMRVIRNLVHNAIKFTPPGGKVGVYANADGDDDLRISVIDSGPGIPESEQVRIFERFYKQDRARSKGGTGLGLAIARHIVEGHGGRIWVESSPGQGARFNFTLPRA